MTEVQPNIEVTISNLSLPLGLQFRGDVSDHSRYLEHINADGLEVTPERSRLVGRLLERAKMLGVIETNPFPLESIGRLEERESLLWLYGFDKRHDWSSEDTFFEEKVKSVHSSFVPDGSHDPFSLLFPRISESIEQMIRIQKVVGHGLPGVLYIKPNVKYDDNNAPFQSRGFQPNVHDWQDKWRLTEQAEIAEVEEKMNEAGVDHAVFDVAHAQEFEDPEELLNRLLGAGLVRAVHLGINRIDIAKRNIPLARSTRQARRAFIRSDDAAAKTREGGMAMQVIHHWKENPDQAGRVVLEMFPRLNHKEAIIEQRSIVETINIMVETA